LLSDRTDKREPYARLLGRRTGRRPLLRAAALTGLASVGTALLAACGAAPSTPTGKPATGSASSPSAAGAAPAGQSIAINTHALTGSGRGGVLRIGMSAANVPIPNTPATEGGEGSRFVGTQIYEGLTRLNTDQADRFPTPQPGMAESWTVGDDKLTWTFKLRQGQKFHDGTPFNAEAVKFAFDRSIDKTFEFYDPTLASANLQRVAGIGSYGVVDEHTFKIVTNRPYAFLLWDLQGFLLPSPTAVRKHGNKAYAQYAAGTGPFRMTRYVDGQVMELEPNEGYWQGKPKLDKIVLLPIPEPAARLASLQAGDVDWAEVPPPDAVRQLKDAGFQIITGPYPHAITYQLNASKPPFNDVRMRQAVNYAVNRDSTVAVINGLGIPAPQYVHKGHPYYDPDWAGYSYDPARVRALMAEAGFAGGVKVKMAYPPGGSGNMWPGPMNERLKADLKPFGIDVELVPIEWNNIISGYRAGFVNPDWAGYDMIHISLGISNPVSARNFTSSGIPPQGCCNTPSYANPTLDAAYAEAERTFDEERQNALLRKVLSGAMQDGFALVTVHDLNLRVLSKKVRNFVQPQAWTVDLYNVYMEKSG
jgi:peptide/nickel transport system substrate-binding protein